MPRLLPQSASWDKPKAKKSNLTHHSQPRTAALCDSVAKFGREDLENAVQAPPPRFGPVFRLFWG